MNTRSYLSKLLVQFSQLYLHFKLLGCIQVKTRTRYDFIKTEVLILRQHWFFIVCLKRHLPDHWFRRSVENKKQMALRAPFQVKILKGFTIFEQVSKHKCVSQFLNLIEIETPIQFLRHFEVLLETLRIHLQRILNGTYSTSEIQPK